MKTLSLVMLLLVGSLAHGRTTIQDRVINQCSNSSLGIERLAKALEVDPLKNESSDLLILTLQFQLAKTNCFYSILRDSAVLGESKKLREISGVDAEDLNHLQRELFRGATKKASSPDQLMQKRSDRVLYNLVREFNYDRLESLKKDQAIRDYTEARLKEIRDQIEFFGNRLKSGPPRDIPSVAR